MSFVNGIGRNNDWIEFKILDRFMINIMYFQKTFNEIIFNNNLDMRTQWIKDKVSPFEYNINNTNTPARLFLISRKGLNLNLKYDENIQILNNLLD